MAHMAQGQTRPSSLKVPTWLVLSFKQKIYQHTTVQEYLATEWHVGLQENG